MVSFFAKKKKFEFSRIFDEYCMMQFSWAPVLRDVSRLEINGAEKANRLVSINSFAQRHTSFNSNESVS